MINQAVGEVKEALMGKAQSKVIVKRVTEVPDPDEIFPSLTMQDDPMKWYFDLVVYIVHLMYHGILNKFDEMRETHKLYRTDVDKAAEVAIDFAYSHAKYNVCLKLIEVCDVDPGRVTKTFLYYFREYLERHEFEKASKLWENYRERGIPVKVVEEEVEKVFKKVSTFRLSNQNRNYAPMFQLAELFNIPKSATHWIATAQYKFNMKIKDYYTAALISKKLNLHINFTNNAAIEALKHAFNRFRDKILNGKYSGSDDISPSDPLNIATNLVEEFDLYDITGIKGNKDPELIREVNGLAKDILLTFVNVGKNSGNAPEAVYKLAVRMLSEYSLLSEAINPSVAQSARDAIKRLIDDIEVTTKNDVDVQFYFTITKSLRTMYSREFIRFDPIAINLTKTALEKKEVDLAGEICKSFSCPLVEIRSKVLKHVYDWTEQEDFDSIIKAVKYYPIHHELKKNQSFMKKLKAYYKEAITSHKFLKAFTIAEAFRLDRSSILEAIRMNISKELEKENLQATKKLLRKYKVKRAEYIPILKDNYLSSIQTNREFAVRLRGELGLSIFDVGIMNWFLHELIRLPVSQSGE